MAEMGTDTVAEQPGTTMEEQTAAQAAADTETAAEQTGQTEEEKKAAEAAEAKAKEEEEEQEFHKRFPKAQDRINKKIGAAHAEKEAAREAELRAKEEAAYLRGKVEALEKGGASSREDTAQPDGIDPNDPEPTPEQFEDNAGFVKALSSWEWRRNDRIRTTTTAKQGDESKMVGLAQEGIKQFGQDFERNVVRNPDFKLSPALWGAVKESDHGTDLLNHLSNKAERDRVMALSPVKQIMEVARIEAGIAAKKAAPPAAPPPGKKNADLPPPPATVSKGSSPMDPSKLSDEEAVKLEIENERKRRAGGKR